MLPRLVLAAFAIGIALVLVFSQRPWAATSMPRLHEIAVLPETAEVEIATSGADFGIVIPYRRDQTAAPVPSGPYRSVPKLGYSYREVSLARMPFWAHRELGFVRYSESADGYYAEPLAAEQMERLAAIAGRDWSRSYTFPIWRHLWGWLFAAGFALWFFLQHRARVKWREEHGII